MQKNGEDFELYKTSLKIAMNEGNMFWQSSQLFLLSNTIIGTAIATLASKQNLDSSNRWEIFVMSILGFLVTLVWFISYQRRWSYYKFRMAQVRENEPKNWHLIKERGKLFSEGAEVEADGEKYRMPRPARIFHTEEIHLLIIIIFILAFATAIYFFWPFR